MPERAAAVRLSDERSAKSIKADAKQPEVPAPAKRIHSGAAPAGISHKPEMPASIIRLKPRLNHCLCLMRANRNDADRLPAREPI